MNSWDLLKQEFLKRGNIQLFGLIYGIFTLFVLFSRSTSFQTLFTSSLPPLALNFLLVFCFLALIVLHYTRGRDSPFHRFQFLNRLWILAYSFLFIHILLQFFLDFPRIPPLVIWYLSGLMLLGWATVTSFLLWLTRLLPLAFSKRSLFLTLLLAIILFTTLFFLTSPYFSFIFLSVFVLLPLSFFLTKRMHTFYRKHMDLSYLSKGIGFSLLGITYSLYHVFLTSPSLAALSSKTKDLLVFALIFLIIGSFVSKYLYSQPFHYVQHLALPVLLLKNGYVIAVNKAFKEVFPELAPTIIHMKFTDLFDLKDEELAFSSRSSSSVSLIPENSSPSSITSSSSSITSSSSSITSSSSSITSSSSLPSLHFRSSSQKDEESYSPVYDYVRPWVYRLKHQSIDVFVDYFFSKDYEETVRVAFLIPLQGANNEVHVTSLDKLKKDVISTVVHEIRTPLSVAIGYLELYFKKKNETYLVKCQEALKNANAIVSKMKYLTISEQNEVLDLEYVNPKELVESAVSDIVAKWKHKPMDFHLNVEDAIVNWDRSLILQALYALIDNAIKYSPIHSRISIRGNKELDQYILHIEDKGMGMSEEEIEKAFDLFERSERVQQIAGSGIGLNIVKQIISSHRGEIRIFSAGPEKGTIFTIILPVDPTVP